jgi:hypothetical protein
MVDNLKIKQPQDPRTINTHEEWEMNYWSKALGASKEQIKKAVSDVGSSVEKVRKKLGK